jgi:hypothetical protein
MRSFVVVCLVILLSNLAFSQAPTIDGCPIFPADNPWNLDISKYPVHPNSDVFISAINKTRQYLHADFGSDSLYGIPFTIVDSTQPPIQITYNRYADQSDPGPFPVPSNALVEGGWNAPSNSDRHVLVVDRSNCMLYEFWQAFKDQTGTGWTMANGAKFDLKANTYRADGWTSADAAGLPIFPGLVKYEEVASGVIEHAVRFTVDNSQRGWIHPARHKAGKNDPTFPPMGLRLRLKESYDISNVTGQSKIILQALKKYGMIIADNGSSWFISGTSNPKWDDNDLNQLKKIPGSAFEAVYTGPIKTSASSITVTSPKAGESISAGTVNYLVKCTTSGVDTLRTLEFSSDGGSTWMTVSGTRGTTTYSWAQIPNIATTHAMIRISDQMANVATSAMFTITSKNAVRINNANDLDLTTYPNPASDKTEITFTLPESEFVSLKIYNAEGIEITTLASGLMETGVHSIVYNAHALPDGIYFLRMNAGAETIGRKIIILR